MKHGGLITEIVKEVLPGKDEDEYSSESQ
jgi:hypothetical protein